MTSHVICVSSNVPRLSSVVRQLLPAAEVIDATPDRDGRSEIPLNTEVLFGDTPSIISYIKNGQSKLKWAQSTWAGVESILEAFPKVPEGVIITRMGEGFGRLMAEYVVGHIFARELSALNLYKQQQQKLWNKGPVEDRRMLTSLTIGILGVGSISTEIAQLCKAVGMTVWGLSRSTKEHNSAFDHLTTLADLSGFLAGCDYICNVLPGTSETKNMLSGDVLKCCKPKRPIFINVGRGSIINEESLLSALENKWIGGAILDVFSKEPLPSESSLWSHPCITVTPHISGPCVAEIIAEVFVKNYEKYINNQRLNHIVDWTKGY
ncbi:glyoxylate/hydroxypyruvate reductase A-like [Saccostrea echinata]|uniref:glyoxylate/hydroxypyruvate reductase A-like n=1 Tax=Saccostrea echinata TaxID=191078 RepID=UPI002A7F7076|nr:glyoxylate/hydroxypyruvate reductase A-like [Saccostrea echinata]